MGLSIHLFVQCPNPLVKFPHPPVQCPFTYLSSVQTQLSSFHTHLSSVHSPIGPVPHLTHFSSVHLTHTYRQCNIWRPPILPFIQIRISRFLSFIFIIDWAVLQASTD